LDQELKQLYKAYKKKESQLVLVQMQQFSLHGDNAKEFVLMTEAGMPAMKAIQAATQLMPPFCEMEKKIMLSR
jgi:hypothetical protein